MQAKQKNGCFITLKQTHLLNIKVTAGFKVVMSRYLSHFSDYFQIKENLKIILANVKKHQRSNKNAKITKDDFD